MFEFNDKCTFAENNNKKNSKNKKSFVTCSKEPPVDTTFLDKLFSSTKDNIKSEKKRRTSIEKGKQNNDMKIEEVRSESIKENNQASSKIVNVQCNTNIGDRSVKNEEFVEGYTGDTDKQQTKQC